MTATLTAPQAARGPGPLRGLARGGAVNVVATGVAGCAGLGVTWLAARGLGTAHAGGFFTATAAFVLGVTVSKVGTQTSLVYWPARLRTLGDPGAVRACLRTGLTPVLWASVAVGAALWAGAAAAGPELRDPLRVLAVFVPAAALTDAVLAATRGFRAMRPTVLLDKLVRPGAQLVLLGALTLAVVTGRSVATGWFAAAWAVAWVPVLAAAAYALGRLVPPAQPSTFDTRAYWAFTGPRALASVAQAALQRVDVLLLAALGGLPAAALYAVAGRFVVLGQLVNGGLSQQVQPRLAERLAAGDIPGVNLLYRQSTAWLVLLTWPVHLTVAAWAEVYLGLFGPAYASGTPVVFTLAGAMLVATGCGMVDMVLAMGGRTWWNLANVGVALGVLVSACLLLIPRFGALGAALALAAALLANNLVPLAQVWATLGVHPFGRATLVAGGLAATCFGVPPLALRLASGGAPPTVPALAVTACGAAVYLLGALRLKETLIRGSS